MSSVPPQLRTKILLVEDSRLDARLTTHALQHVAEWPLSIEVVDDGDKALKFLSQNDRPDLVILDLNLPKRDGYEVLQVIRETESLRDLLVFIFSSCPAFIAEERMLSLQLKPDRYFEKPNENVTYGTIAEQMRDAYQAAARVRSIAMAG